MLRDAGLANFNCKGEQNISKYFLRGFGYNKNKLEQLNTNWRLGKLMTQLFLPPPPRSLSHPPHLLLFLVLNWYLVILLWSQVPFFFILNNFTSPPSLPCFTSSHKSKENPEQLDLHQRARQTANELLSEATGHLIKPNALGWGESKAGSYIKLVGSICLVWVVIFKTVD